MKLSEYILLPLEQRRSHINLSTPCIPLSKGSYWRGRQRRFDSHDIVNDLENLQQAKVSECHLCPNCESPKICGNPDHIYIGTQRENIFDIDPALRRQRGLIAAKFLPPNAKILNAQRWQCLVTGKVSTPGPLTLWQRTRGIDTKQRKQIND